GLLGEVVVHDEGVLAVLHPVLAHRAPAVGRQVLERRRVGGRCGDDDGAVHRPVLAQRLDGLGDGRALLADRHVDALHALTLLVQDRVDGDGGLAGLAVADDQLALAAPDRGHGVDRLDAGLEGLVHGLAAHDAGRLDLHPAQLRAGQLALAVDGLTESVDDATEHTVADGHGEDPTGRLDGLALLDVARLAEHHGADRVLVEVEGEADRAVLELEQLVHGGVGQSRDAGDAVADRGHPADGSSLERAVGTFQVVLDRRCDVGGGDGEFCHGPFRLQTIGAVSQRRLFSCSTRVRTLPSMTVSPTVATMPPTTDGSTITLRLTCLPVALASAAWRRVCWSSVSATAVRTSASSSCLALDALATSLLMIAGRSRPRPEPTTIETSCVVVPVALPPSRSSTIAWRLAAGISSSVRAVRSSSLDSNERAKRNSSSSTSSIVPSARATSNSARA